MILTGTLRDIAGADTDGTISILSRVTRESVDNPGELITREIHREPIEDGRFRIEGLEAGPVTIELTAGNEYSRWDINLPDDDSEHDIAGLVELQVEWEPDVVSRARAAQRASEAAAERSEAGANRVGSAEAVLEARDQSQTAAGDAIEAAGRSNSDADRAKEEADRADGRATAAGNAATASATSAGNAKTSETNAAGSATSAAADRVQTGKDRTATGSDRIATGADRTAAAGSASTATTQADRAKNEADRSTTQAGRAKTEADRASEAADLADGAAVQAVTDRVNTLLEGAPEAYDTLREVGEKLAAQDDVASALTSQIAGKASKQELADGLAGKANASHTHTTAQVTGLDTALAGKASTQALTDGLATRVEGGSAVKKIEVVTAMPSNPVATTLYLVVG